MNFDHHFVLHSVIFFFNLNEIQKIGTDKWFLHTNNDRSHQYIFIIETLSNRSQRMGTNWMRFVFLSQSQLMSKSMIKNKFAVRSRVDFSIFLLALLRLHRKRYFFLLEKLFQREKCCWFTATRWNWFKCFRYKLSLLSRLHRISVHCFHFHFIKCEKKPWLIGNNGGNVYAHTLMAEPN